jgi:zinc protease
LPTLTTATDPKTAYSLSLLSDVLDGGLSARLEKHLVRDKQLLASVGSGYSAFSRGDGLLLIQATPRQGVSLEQAKAAILAEIEALKTQPIATRELERAKTNTLTELIYSQDSISGQAQTIGSLTSIGLDDRMIYNLPSVLDSINESDLHQVASKYLTHENLTILNVVNGKVVNNNASSTKAKTNK